MPEDWWRKLFNALYIKTDGDVVENADATQSEVDQLIELTGLQPYQHVPALLETLEIPYTGAPPRCLAACYDKSLVVAEQLDIPVPDESFIRPGDHSATLPSIFPAILKPNFGDSSEGITQDAVVHDQGALLGYLDKLREAFPERPVLVQEFLQGAEFSVWLIGNAETSLTALPVLEVDFSNLKNDLPQILGYESKWDPGSPYWTDIRYREAPLPDQSQARLIDHAMHLFERLGCRDYARFDFRAHSNGTIKLLEANPNPGWCWDGKQNLMAGFAGMSYANLLGAIVGAAESRLGLGMRRSPIRKVNTAAA